MKLHIDNSQLNELSDKAKDKLRAWWYPDRVRVHDLYRLGESDDDIDIESIGCCEIEVSEGQVLPILSIGQMIEFLGDHTDGIYNYPVSEHDGVKYLNSQFIDGNDIETLCDWLWESVKQVLEDKE